jgi:hypothetical protein
LRARYVTGLAVSAGLAIALAGVTVAEERAAPVTHRTLVAFGDAYTSAEELYDVAITIQEVIEGDAARDRLSATPSGAPAPAQQYLLVRLKFDYAARSAPGDQPYALAENQFTVVSAQGTEYPALNGVSLPSGLRGVLRAPGSLDGWVAFQVDRNEHVAQLVFREDVGNTMYRGGGFAMPLR